VIPTGRVPAESRLKDHDRSAGSLALQVQAPPADVHEFAVRCRRWRSGSDCHERTGDRDEQQDRDKSSDEPSADPAQLTPQLHEHPDREDSEGDWPNPTEQIHDRRPGLQQGEDGTDAGQRCGWHVHPSLRLAAEPDRQPCHQRPPEAERQQHGSGHHGLGTRSGRHEG
jgi:hypothetical protein